MRLWHLFALLAIVAIPATSRAADLTPLYPDSAVFAFGFDIKGITTSPLGKKVIGADKPFDASRKLLNALLPEGTFPLTDKALKPLESVANRLERITGAGSIEGGSHPPIAIFLEGEIDEADYIKAAEGYAEAEKKQFSTAKLGERKLLILGNADAPIYGLRLSKSLFLLTSTRDLIDEILAKHDGKRKAKIQPALTEWQKKVKPAETPIWLAVGELKILQGITGGVATIGLKSDADFNIEIACDKEELAKTVKTALDYGVDYLAREKSPQAVLWHAAKIKVARDGTTVTATGSIPGKLLAEEYAKQK